MRLQFIIAHLLIGLGINAYSQEPLEHERNIEDCDKFMCKEIIIHNPEEQINLSGTLLEPRNYYDKMVIIVPGSGKDTRHNHFILAQELLENNIAVFRYDERGLGESEGKFNNVGYGITQMGTDLFYIIKHLQGITNKRLGTLGHSMGGLMVMKVLEKGAKVDFLVQWAAPVEKPGEAFKYQLKSGMNNYDRELKFDDLDKKLEIMDVIHTTIENNKKDDDVTLGKKVLKEARKHGYKRRHYDRFYYTNFPSTKDLLRQDFQDVYKNIDVPMLYIIGSEDRFVDPKSNTELLKSFENENIEIEILNGLNHYLKKGEFKGMILSNYEISEQAKTIIIDWITGL